MDLQKAQQLRSDMQDITTLTISTVSQFNLLSYSSNRFSLVTNIKPLNLNGVLTLRY